MKIKDKAFIMRPPIVKMFAFFLTGRFVLDPILNALWGECNDAYNCVSSVVFGDWQQIVLFSILMAVIFNRIYIIEIENEHDIVPDNLKLSGSRRVDLSKEYSVIEKNGSLVIVQNNKKYQISKYMYSRVDIERLNSIIKI